MGINLRSVEIDVVIAHEIPRRTGSSGPQPVLSEIDSPLSPTLRHYFAEKLQDTLVGSGYEVVLDPASNSPVPGLVVQSFGERSTFITMSQEIAKHLFDCQTPINPEGLLFVIACQADSIPAIALLKLEKETGVRAQQSNKAGKRYFDIQHLNDLMLTQKTRVFKTGIFLDRRDGVKVHAADNQQGFNPRTGIAGFFLKKFLGCMLAEEPRVLTKRFFDATEAFINSAIEDPARKAKYHVALLAEIQSNRSNVSSGTFARHHLDVPDRKPFQTFLAERAVPSEFPKDSELVQRIAKKTQLQFKSGISVIGSPETFSEHVNIERISGGRTRVKIEDHLAAIRGRGT